MKNLLNTRHVAIDIVKGFGIHVVYWDGWHIMIGCIVITIES